MDINLVVAHTDTRWFTALSQNPGLTEVNFWRPSTTSFRALKKGELFLFRLKSPINCIAGGGVFAHASNMPCSYAWGAFGVANGADSESDLRKQIQKYRNDDPNDRTDFQIGCRILNQPFFFSETDWIPLAGIWKPGIQSFKRLNTGDSDGQRLWDAVHERLALMNKPLIQDTAQFGKPQIIEPRLGQGSFRFLVTDLYDRRCVVTRERTLPALEAAHIRPYSQEGKHTLDNGLLLRRDIHTLFDLGYVTVTPEMTFIVSKKIREEFENGKEYYDHQNTRILGPSDITKSPNPKWLTWHNENVYKG